MPDARKIFTLSQVAKSIQNALSTASLHSYWISAEIVKLNHYPRSGHCYPDLVEKKDQKIVAQFRANIWKDDYARIQQNFTQILGTPIQDGIRILFLGRVQFHPVHGISLHITEIDPTFTVGELELEKRQTLLKLEVEGLLNRNKELKLPMLPSRIAVISVESSKGYGDFNAVIDSAIKDRGYPFTITLYASVLQGDSAQEEMIRVLEKISFQTEKFDAVAIVRGGGTDLSLSVFNRFPLAKAVACCPLPVLTGIGHSANLTVVEQVARHNYITPTKLAEELVDRFDRFAHSLLDLSRRMASSARQIMLRRNAGLVAQSNKLLRESRALTEGQKGMLNRKTIQLSRATSHYYHTQVQRLKDVQRTMVHNQEQMLKARKRDIGQFASLVQMVVPARIHLEKIQCAHLSRNVKNMSPEHVLKRGYSITRAGGVTVRFARDMDQGTILETELYRGTLRSVTIEPAEIMKKNINTKRNG